MEELMTDNSVILLEACQVRLYSGFYVFDNIVMLKNIATLTDCILACARYTTCISASYLVRDGFCLLSSTNVNNPLILLKNIFQSVYIKFECEESK